jgi:hypothetical protein
MKYNIKMDMRKIGRCGLDSSGLGQEPVAVFCESSGFHKRQGIS